MTTFEGEYVIKMRTPSGKLKEEFRFTKDELKALQETISSLLDEETVDADEFAQEMLQNMVSGFKSGAIDLNKLAQNDMISISEG